MRALVDADTLQIEITSGCVLACSNCTRFVGHAKPFYMDVDYFEKVIDSLEGYPKMRGIMGGEPLLHPQFPEICEILKKKVPRRQCGLWSVFPQKFEKYRELICETFYSVFLNDHTRDDIYHFPLLTAIKEVIPDKRSAFLLIDKCWIQNHWSPSVTPNGAYFCEVAAAMSHLFKGSKGWDITEPGWWKRIPKDFTEQMEEYCLNCGGALPLAGRKSIEDKDDVSPGVLVKLQEAGSPRAKSGAYEVTKWVMDGERMLGKTYPVQTYKDRQYRDGIAARYGIFLSVNEFGFEEPYLKKDWRPNG